MIGEPIDILAKLQGGLGKDYYSRKHANPKYVILQRKPDRTLKRGESTHPNQLRNREALLAAKERAKEIYNTPELRAEWERRYKELEAQCIKKQSRAINGGKAMKAFGGYDLPYHLWPWIYGECLREAYRNHV